MRKLGRLQNLTVKDLLITVVVINLWLLLSSCASRPIKSTEQSIQPAEKLNSSHDVCIVVDTFDLHTPVAMTMGDKTELKKDISKRSKSHLKQYFAAKNMKTHFAEECDSDTVRILLNYTMFEVGNDSNDYILLSGSEKDHVKAPYKLKVEVSIYLADGHQVFDDVQLENGTDLSAVIDAIVVNAENRFEDSLKDRQVSSSEFH